MASLTTDTRGNCRILFADPTAPVDVARSPWG